MLFLETNQNVKNSVSKVTAKLGDITDVVTQEYDANGALTKEVKEDGTIYTYSDDNMNCLVVESIKRGSLEKTWTTDYSYGSVEINTGRGKERNAPEHYHRCIGTHFRNDIQHDHAAGEHFR